MSQVYIQAGLVIFLLVVGVLMVLGWRRTETISDFAIASENLGPYTLGVAYAATQLSVATVVGYVGWAYGWGLSVLWAMMPFLLVTPIVAALIARRVRHSNIEYRTVSLPDWVGAFYDSQALRVFVAVAVLFNVFYIAGQLAGGAQMFVVFLEWGFTDALIAITVIVTLYVMLGGTYADIWTDTIMGILMVGLAVFLFLSALWVLADTGLSTWGHVASELHAQDPNLTAMFNPESALFYSATAVGAIFVMQFAFSVQPQLFNKILALNEPRNLRKMLATYYVTLALFTLIIFTGFYARVVEPGLENMDQSIFVYAEGYFIPIVGTVMAIVILAAALSTTDGLYIAVVTALANDIFLRYFVGEGIIEMEEERASRVSHRLAQVATVLAGIAGFYIALRPPFGVSIGEMVWLGIAAVGAATFAPIIFGVYFPEFVTRKGALASAASGVGLYLILTLAVDIPSVFVRGTYAVFTSIAAMAVVSYLTEQEPGVASGLKSSEAKLDEQMTAGSDD